MEQIILLAIQAVEALLPTLAGATSGQLQSVVVLMEKIVPIVAQLGVDAVGSVQNIVAELTNHAAATPAQVATLQTQSDALDAALDAIAASDGLV